MKTTEVIVAFILTLSLLSFPSLGFQSDELLVDDEEFGLEGAPQPRSPEPIPSRSQPVTTPTRKRHSDLDSDSKIQFSLDHAFGDSDFTPAGTFSARLKTWSHGGQVYLLFPFSIWCKIWLFIVLMHCFICKSQPHENCALKFHSNPD